MSRIHCIALTALLAAPAALEAQACQGSPAPRGSAIVTGEVSFPEGATTYAGRLGGYFDAPVFASGFYAYTDVDDTEESLRTVGGEIGGELLTSDGVSLCATGGFAHSWVPDVDVDGQTWTADASVGRSFPAGELLVTPHGAVGVVHQTASVGPFDASDTAASFAGGVTVGSRRVFVGGSVSYTTFDEADPVFGVGLGVIF